MKIPWDVTIIEGSLFWIPLLPLLGAAAIGAFGRKLNRGDVAVIACGTVATSALLVSLVLFPMAAPRWFPTGLVVSVSDSLGTWFHAGSIQVQASFMLDHLSAILALVVAGVGLIIHVYSIEYMREDEGFARYFAYLNLFVGSMLLLVMANDLVLMFVGWEGVGLCSYLLIGFWYDDEAKATAGRKAFIVNRIGDVGLLLGLFLLLALYGTTAIQPTADQDACLLTAIDPSKLARAVATGPLAALGVTRGQALTAALLLISLGVAGKSAQLPLYLWLPDAMNGPTPVSALIHAATMVTAGVYLIARLAFLYAQSLTAMAVVATVGAATALFGALLAFAQNDIKKVLAYSTISQLGFMVMAVGLGAWWQGFFHLVTHAFFKACLFLGAGSVILACHHEQDIRRLGGLRKRLPQTTITFLIATLAITGVAPLSGFFSKEAILHFAHAAAPAGLQGLAHVLAFVGMLAALCTAFYMFRLYFLVFEGEPRSEKAANAAEQRPTITVPLWILAGLSIVALIWGWPWKPFALPTLADGGLEPILQNFLSPVFRNAAFTLGIGPVAGGKGLLVAMGIAWAIALAGLLFAFLVYRCGGRTLLSPLIDRGPGRWIRVAVSRAFFVDEICHYVLVVPFRIVSKLAFHLIDDALIDGLLVRGTGRVTAWSGRVLRRLQNGDVQRYAAVMALGAVVTLAVAMGIWTDLASFFTGAH